MLVANLNARNDQLRREISTLEDELAALNQNRSRGEESIDELRADLRRVRAYAGLDPVGGPGVTISISGPIDGSGVEELINELRNAGAEAIGAGWDPDRHGRRGDGHARGGRDRGRARSEPSSSSPRSGHRTS